MVITMFNCYLINVRVEPENNRGFSEDCWIASFPVSQEEHTVMLTEFIEKSDSTILVIYANQRIEAIKWKQ